MRPFTGDYEGVMVAGLAIVAADTGRVFLAQRSYDETDAEDVRESWEFPGGHLEPGEDPLMAAYREFQEEIGPDLTDSVLFDDTEVVSGWRAGDDGQYQGFVLLVPDERIVESQDPEWKPTIEVQNVGWFTREEAMALDNLRPEVRTSEAWDLIDAVSGNQEEDMTEQAIETEPEWDIAAALAMPIPIHGVMAPEEVETGDGRAFAGGSMTRRPLRLPFSWQEISVPQHDGSVVLGSVDRLMRKDGMIHWEGSLMPSAESEKFLALLAFFDGRFGVSVDGDAGSLDRARSQATGVMWFDAVRASGLTAVAIPAFHEAYVAFGHHPDMPEDDTDAVLSASGLTAVDIAGARRTFDRGPGWVTHPVETNRIHDYWTKKGQPGYAKIGWGTPGDFTRAKALIGAKIAANSPEDMRFLNQIIAQWHFDALGYWPGELGKPGNPPDTAENRRRAAAHAASRGLALDEDAEGWETVITSSATGTIALPPKDYFSRHPDTGATVIEDPDEFGIKRTYGYAAEWGVCHIGMSGRCVEPPRPDDGSFPEFHLGRTKTTEGYLNTGVLTFMVDHRDAQTILTETAEQGHFDNVANAWAAVRLGIDDRGIWFSGYVLPGITDEECVLIEATGQVSGEWKYGSLRALQSVNVPGYPVLRSSAAFDDEGNVIALVAVTTGKDAALVASMNGVDQTECSKESAKALMTALAKAEAEARMDALRAKWAVA